MQDSARELEMAEESLREIWCDEDEAAKFEDHLHDARLDAIQDRATRAGRKLMELCAYTSEELCPDLELGTE